MADERVKVTQTRSTIGRNQEVRATLQALGLGRIGKERVHVLTASTRGMLRRVEHLIRVVKAD